MKFSRKIAKALEQAVPCKRIGMSVVGLEVPHVHVHLIPLQTMDDIRFSKKETLSPEAFEEVVKKVQQYL